MKILVTTVFVLTFVPNSYQSLTNPAIKSATKLVTKPTSRLGHKVASKTTMQPLDKEIEYKHRNLKDPYMDTYLKEYKPPTNDPKFIAAQSKFYDFIAKPLPTVRPMSPELENCVRTIMKHGIELFNALVFCIADREMDNKSPQEKLEPTRAPKKRDSRGHRDQKDLKDHRKHRDSQDRRDKKEYRQRPTLKPFRQPLDNVGEPEREAVNSIYDRVMLTIGLW